MRSKFLMQLNEQLGERNANKLSFHFLSKRKCGHKQRRQTCHQFEVNWCHGRGKNVLQHVNESKKKKKQLKN